MPAIQGETQIMTPAPEVTVVAEEVEVTEEVVVTEEPAVEEVSVEVEEVTVVEVVPEVVVVEPEVLIEPVPEVVIVEPKPEVLIDYKELDPGEKMRELVVTEEVTVDTLEIVEDPYVKGEMVSVDGNVCERAIGHDGHYDSESGKWMLEEDWDYEPEWRCLMRPLLRESVMGVTGAELSIESKGILEEKQALVRVHERLVKEAEKVARKQSCLEYIERKMSKY